MSTLQNVAFEIADLLLGNGFRWPFVPSLRVAKNVDDSASTVMKVISKFKTVGLKVGVVDLTDKNNPLYFFDNATLNDTVTIGSTSKLAILYAAFQLQDDLLEVLKRDPSITTFDGLIEGVKAYWGGNDKPRSLQILAGTPNNWPRLKQIFSLDSDPRSHLMRLRFAGENNCAIPSINATINASQFALMQGLEAYHDLEHNGTKLQRWRGLLQNKSPDGKPFVPGISIGDPMPFAKRLWLTVRWSDNAAATSCWKDIGAEYQKILMTESGFYKVIKNNKGKFQTAGFHSGETYEGALDVNEINNLNISAAEKNALRAYTAESFGNESFHSGSVGTLLAFLVAMAQGKLINDIASKKMVALLRTLRYIKPDVSDPNISNESFGARSFFNFDNTEDPNFPFPFYHLKSAHGELDNASYYDYWSKIGIVRDIYSDCVFMDFEARNNRRALGLVILHGIGDTTDNNDVPLVDNPMNQCAYGILKLFAENTDT